MNNYPKVLLLGNGINRSFAGDDWNDLVKKLHINRKVPVDSLKDVPFPLKAVLSTNDNVYDSIKNNDELFYGLSDEKLEESRSLMESLLDIPFDYILTTNYSYEIERIADPKIRRDGKNCKSKNLVKGNRVEGKYLLSSYTNVSSKERPIKVFHIHGEAKKPDSIILGHYYYGSLLSKMQSRIQNNQFIIQKQGKPPVVNSWMDAFIMGDVYTLGFGFDLSEMDLWWLLCRKKREKAEHGKLYFYESSSDDNSIKHALLESYGGECKSLGYRGKPDDYISFYKDAIEDISKQINN